MLFQVRSLTAKPAPASGFRTLARVWRYARAYPWLALATFLCAITTTATGLLFPKITQRVIDDVLIPRRPELLWPYILVAIGAFFLRDLLNALRIRFNNTFEQALVFDLRRDLYATLQRLPLRWYDERATGEIITRVVDDVTNMERVLVDGIEQGAIAVLQIVGVGAFLFATNARLAALMLIPVPFLILGALWYTLTAPARYRLQRRAASAMNALLLDNLQGIRQIKAYAREETELERFAAAARQAGDAQMVIMKSWAGYSSWMSFIAALGAPLVLYFGGQDVIFARHGFRLGELTEFLLYVAMFYDPISRLHQINQLYQAGRVGGERVAEILDAVTENYGAAPSSPAHRFQGRIEYRDVGFAYTGQQPALREITFTVEPGQTVALVGPTGAGKSTLVSLLSRFYEITGGEVLLDGRPVGEIPLHTLRNQIGLVSQESFLFNGTILENLRFGRPDATLEEVEAVSRAACIYDFIQLLPEKYQSRVGERGIKLSVGEKQRISIARALLKNPPILILDEATASVDTATEQLIQQALSQLLQNRTALVIAHRLSTIRHADLILVLQQGRIVERGTHAELLARNGLYARLCHAQQTDRIDQDGLDRLFAENHPTPP